MKLIQHLILLFAYIQDRPREALGEVTKNDRPMMTADSLSSVPLNDIANVLKHTEIDDWLSLHE